MRVQRYYLLISQNVSFVLAVSILLGQKGDREEQKRKAEFRTTFRDGFWQWVITLTSILLISTLAKWGHSHEVRGKQAISGHIKQRKTQLSVFCQTLLDPVTLQIGPCHPTSFWTRQGQYENSALIYQIFLEKNIKGNVYLKVCAMAAN